MRQEIVEHAQQRIANEILEDEQVYIILHNGSPASQPWIHKEYELRPIRNIGGLGLVRSRYGEMTVPLPLLQKARWETIIRNSLPEPPAAVIETEQLKFQAYYLDEEVTFRVRYETADAGEEHLVDLLPHWQVQMLKINQAFRRKMIPDDSKQSKNNVAYVKAEDGAPRDPLFERLMKSTLGDGSEEFSVRIKKGQTTRDVKEGLKYLHAGINPSKLMWEGSEMDDAVTEWATTTGSAPLKVQIVLGQPVQRFRLWQHSGVYGLGGVDLSGKSKEDIWGLLKTRNLLLRNLEEYRLFRSKTKSIGATCQFWMQRWSQRRLEFPVEA
jgi:hypothetical protein